MSMPDRQSCSREPQEQPPSHLAAVLHRVGIIRGSQDLVRSPTTPSRRQKRRNRLLGARLSIAERLVSYLSADRSPTADQRRRRVWIAIALVLFCSVVAGIEISRHWTEQFVEEEFTFQVSGTAPFLSEQLALAKVREALSEVVRRPSALTPIMTDAQSRTAAPDGRRDVCLIREGGNAGVLFFNCNGKIWDVRVQLRRDTVQCTVRGIGSRWTW